MANNDNIIYAKFNHGREITTDSRSQYAYGQVLQISGLHLPASFDADVSNKGDKQAVQRIGTDNELPIDDAFFLSGKDVIVMINVHAANNDGRTKYIIRIPVEKRPKRTDIEVEPVEQNVISTAIAALNEAVEQTSISAENAENSANHAQQSAIDAKTSATNASNSETLAQQYMERAETAAENAEQSETKAKTSEDNAKASEEHIEQIENNIEQYTERAETASTNARSSASIATQKATEALSSANIATTKANEALVSATNAQNSANSAQQSATNAQTYMNSASASASKAQVNAEKTQNDKEIVELAKADVISAVSDARGYASNAEQSATNAEESAQSALASKEAIENMSVTVQTLNPDQQATVTKEVDSETGAITINYGIPKGDKGDTGEQGIQGEKGDNGQDYILTENDKQEIAGLVDVPVDDVQINGTSIVNNNVVNIPIASSNNAGVVKINPSFGVSLVNDVLIINGANSNDIKSANNSTKAISTLRQHEATFYGLAKASGDTTQAQSEDAIGTYTDDAKASIQSMLGVPSEDDVISDVQINGTSIVTNGIANIPKAADGVGGVARGATGYGTRNIAASNGDTIIGIYGATDAAVKAGENGLVPLTPLRQHKSVFYGLAKASGDTTQAQSNNAVGTYTNEAKASIQSMLGIDMDSKVDKTAIENAGITNKTYTTKFGGEFSVTTVEDSDYISPYARATVTGRINKEYMHRVTVNGTEYILPTGLWYEKDGAKVYEYLGNLGLYISDTSGVPGGINDVPFVIISDLDNNSSIDVLTSTTGAYTILVEQINNVQNTLPPSLIYGDSYIPLVRHNNGGTYSGFSMGVNELTNKRATFAFGYGNKISNQFNTAIGTFNDMSGLSNIALGQYNTISGDSSIAIGNDIEITANDATAIGNGTIANSNNIFVIGRGNSTALEPEVLDWQANTEYKRGDIVYITIVATYKMTMMCTNDHTSGTVALEDANDRNKWIPVPGTGHSAFVIGNGMPHNSLGGSNAFKVDWIGDVYCGGDVYVDCDKDSNNGTKLVKESDLEDYAKTDDVVTDVQINGTSIINNGVADIPIASSSEKGVVGIDQTNGITITTSSGNLIINPATLSSVKAGTNTRYPIVPAHVHEAAFYGLAKAAGDITQSASANEVGTYTDEAKTAIKQMLDIKDDYDSLVVEVSGTDPVITGKPSYRYNCGELYTLTVTPPSSGTIDIIFTSGATPTVLDLPSTVKMPDWWAGIEINTIYEMCITDGVYCGVMSWAQ